MFNNAYCVKKKKRIFDYNAIKLEDSAASYQLLYYQIQILKTWGSDIWNWPVKAVQSESTCPIFYDVLINSCELV